MNGLLVLDTKYKKRIIGNLEKNNLLRDYEMSDTFSFGHVFIYYGYFTKNENMYLIFWTLNKRAGEVSFMLCFDKRDDIKSHLRIVWNTYDAWSENIITYFNSSNNFIQKHYVTDLYHSIKDTTYNSKITVTNYEFKGTDIIKKDSYQYAKKVGIGSGKTSMIEYEE